jgi:hypothetical protein
MKITGLPEVQRRIKSIEKQIPFATARALNDTARDVQEATIKQLLPSKFVLRSPWWRPGTRFGFNIRFATKALLRAVIGSRAEWLGVQEQGGVRTPRSARNLSLPINARRSERAVIRKNQRPRALIAAGKAFVMKTKEGLSLLVTRKGKKNVVQYAFHPRANVTTRLAFIPSGMAKARAVYRKHFQKRIAEAIRSAK